MNGGRFDFDDGGTYCGGWEEGKAHGHGVCTGPDQKGEYAGAYHYGLEVSGVYTWPSGSTYQGQWQNGKRHGFGVETRGRWTYRGEWSQGLKGRYGLRQALHSQANYLGTWSTGLHDGYGTETYVDGGTYKGQWQRGLRHGYGIRTSAPYSVAAKYYRSRSQTNASLTSLRSDLVVDDPEPSKKDKKNPQGDEEEFRGGFVLRVRSEAPARRRRSLSERSLAVKRTILNNLRIKKQHSTGDINQRVTSMTGSLRSSGSTMSCTSDESDHNRNINDFNGSEERIEGTVVESYKGEWKNDKRSGYGICERTDNVKYLGEWFNNRKHGYGVTYFKDGTKEEGRYKNNVLVCSTRRKGIMFVRSSKLRERIEASVEAAKRAADMAAQRVEITLSRTQTAQERAENAIQSAKRARDDADTARICAIQFDPTFQQPGIEHIRQNRGRHGILAENHAYANHVSFESTTSPNQTSPHHRLVSGPPSVSTDPNYATNMPNFAPQQLYQQSIQSLNTQTPISHNNPLLNQPYSSNSPAQQQQQVELHAYDTSLQTPQQAQTAVPQLDSTYLAQQQHHQQQYASEEMARIDQEAAYLLQQQQASSSNAQNQIPLAAQHTVHLQHQQPQFTMTSENDPRATHMGNSVGNRLHTSTSLTADAIPTTAEASASPRIRQLRNAAEGRSTISLSDDHYDQYTINKQPNSTNLRKNRPSLTRQTEVLDAVHLNRRSTLATARDRQGPSKGRESLFGWEHGATLGAEGDRGSLPDLNELAEHGISLKREDAARLASQRRQETQRLLEEEELLRANPLRYIYHPALRNWVNAHRGVILLIVSNICLLYILIYLLTSDNRNQQQD